MFVCPTTKKTPGNEFSLYLYNPKKPDRVQAWQLTYWYTYKVPQAVYVTVVAFFDIPRISNE
jgi:hypothetical protein